MSRDKEAIWAVLEDAKDAMTRIRRAEDRITQGLIQSGDSNITLAITEFRRARVSLSKIIQSFTELKKEVVQ